MKSKKISTQLSDLHQIVDWILLKSNFPIILFDGEMGAGKTTLIQKICEVLKVEDTVSSPTFSLVNEYFSPEKGAVYHFDFYRIDSEEEALDIGLYDYLDSGNWCFIEWPEKIANLLPEECVRISIELNGGARIFTMQQPDK